ETSSTIAACSRTATGRIEKYDSSQSIGCGRSRDAPPEPGRAGRADATRRAGGESSIRSRNAARRTPDIATERLRAERDRPAPAPAQGRAAAGGRRSRAPEPERRPGTAAPRAGRSGPGERSESARPRLAGGQTTAAPPEGRRPGSERLHDREPHRGATEREAEH